MSLKKRKSTLMKIYDCFLFHDETMLLEIRFNILSKYVEKFVISEAKYLT